MVYARTMNNTGNPDPRWLDRKALAEYISVRVDHIPRLLRQGKLPQLSKHLGERTPRWWSGAVDKMCGRTDPGKPNARGAELVRKILATPPRRGCRPVL